MVRDMDVAAIVPQHGKRFEGPVMVDRFLNWVSDMECGIDLMTQDNYQRPVDYV